MSNAHGGGKRPREFDESTDREDRASHRPKIDPDERDEYDEWRRERSGRGRKRKDKAGGRHRMRRDDDLSVDY